MADTDTEGLVRSEVPPKYNDVPPALGNMEQFSVERTVVPNYRPSARDTWTFSWEFAATSLSFLVDASVLLRLPYACYRNGGILFMVIYFIFVILFGLPTFYMELSLGQFSGKGPLHIWNLCPLFRGIGAGMVVSHAAFIFTYSPTLSWLLFYIFKSFSSDLPWMTCSNVWNTDHCLGGNTSDIYMGPSSSSAQEYFEKEVLQISDSVERLGSLQWRLVGTMAGVTALTFLVMFWGVKVFGKVASASLLVIGILTVTLLVRGATLPGSIQGLLFLFTPNATALLRPYTWFSALFSALYSVGVGNGAIHTLASYKKFRSTALRDSCFIVGTLIIFNLVASMMMFCLNGALDYLSGAPVENVAGTGVDHFFSSVPQLLGHLPVGQFWCFVYFLLGFLIFSTTQFVHFEVVLTAICDVLPQKGKKVRVLATAVVCGASLIASLLMLTQGGVYILVLFDLYIAILAFPVLCLLQFLTVGWIYGVGQFSNDIQMMTGMRPPIVYKFLWCFVLPLVSVAVLIMNCYWYSKPGFGFYIYPMWAEVLGWFIALAPLAPLPVFAVVVLATLRKNILTPSPDYLPADASFHETYSYQRMKQRGIVDRLCDVFRS